VITPFLFVSLFVAVTILLTLMAYYLTTLQSLCNTTRKSSRLVLCHRRGDSMIESSRHRVFPGSIEKLSQRWANVDKIHWLNVGLVIGPTLAQPNNVGSA